MSVSSALLGYAKFLPLGLRLFAQSKVKMGSYQKQMLEITADAGFVYKTIL